MTELSKEYFDEQIKKLITKEDMREAVEGLVRVIQAGFDERQSLDKTDRLKKSKQPSGASLHNLKKPSSDSNHQSSIHPMFYEHRY